MPPMRIASVARLKRGGEYPLTRAVITPLWIYGSFADTDKRYGGNRRNRRLCLERTWTKDLCCTADKWLWGKF